MPGLSTVINQYLPIAELGQQPIADSVSVVPAIGSDFATATNQNTALTTLGATADTVATTDIGNFSWIRLFKRALQRISNIYAVQCTGDVVGGSGDNAAVTGTIAAPGAGKAIFIKGVFFSYGSHPASARVLSITSGGATLVDIAITSAGAGPMLISARAATNTAVAYTLPASGGAGNNGRLRISYSIVDVLT
jgi:hypothetical protein